MRGSLGDMRLGGGQNAEGVWGRVTDPVPVEVCSTMSPSLSPLPPICLFVSVPAHDCLPPLLPLLVVSIDLPPSCCLLLSVSPCRFGPVPVSSPSLAFPHFCVSRCLGAPGHVACLLLSGRAVAPRPLAGRPPARPPALARSLQAEGQGSRRARAAAQAAPGVH